MPSIHHRQYYPPNLFKPLTTEQMKLCNTLACLTISHYTGANLDIVGSHMTCLQTLFVAGFAFGNRK